MAAGPSSFADFLTTAAPELLPQSTARRRAGLAGAGGHAADLPHGTTIIAAVCEAAW